MLAANAVVAAAPDFVLVLGLPAGPFVGNLVGWRLTFAMAAAAVASSGEASLRGR